MPRKQPALVMDLDGTLNHAQPVTPCFCIRGTTSNSFISARTLNRLAKLSQRLDLFVATARSEVAIEDFQTTFHHAGIRIAGWILEYGAVVLGKPDWHRYVLWDIPLNQIRQEIESRIRIHGLPVDVERYRDDHKGILLFSGSGPMAAEAFLEQIASVLGDRFRSMVGSRKIALIPKRADKYAAFQANFGHTHTLDFAVGDDIADLPLLKNALYPMVPASANFHVTTYVTDRGGFVARHPHHEGIIAVLDEITKLLDSGPSGIQTPGPRIPHECIEWFRPYRKAYLDAKFRDVQMPNNLPTMSELQVLADRVHHGINRMVEVRMRDWGGEIKPLMALLDTFVPLIPHAKWRLVFRPERLGKENLPHFDAVSSKLSRWQRCPDGSQRFSVPGLVGSPVHKGPPSQIWLLYDHPEDMEPWYCMAIPRLMTRHPLKPDTWFVNPMYLKIGGAQKSCPQAQQILCPDLRIMMAANIIGPVDIRIAVRGFQRLGNAVDALVIAPRVITNPQRNQMILDAVREIGKEPVRFSQYDIGQPFEVLIVDTYGDLPRLYPGCSITYLGGGFNPRKRGFDPLESLVAGVPVITGPIYDYNRITVDGLAHTGWVTRMDLLDPSPETKFAQKARNLIESPPDPQPLQKFILERKTDPLRVALELLTYMAP